MICQLEHSFFSHCESFPHKVNLSEVIDPIQQTSLQTLCLQAYEQRVPYYSFAILTLLSKTRDQQESNCYMFYDAISFRSYVRSMRGRQEQVDIATRLPISKVHYYAIRLFDENGSPLLSSMSQQSQVQASLFPPSHYYQVMNAIGMNNSQESFNDLIERYSFTAINYNARQNDSQLDALRLTISNVVRFFELGASYTKDEVYQQEAQTWKAYQRFLG